MGQALPALSARPSAWIANGWVVATENRGGCRYYTEYLVIATTMYIVGSVYDSAGT